MLSGSSQRLLHLNNCMQSQNGEVKFIQESALISHVILNRAQRLNSLSLEMIRMIRKHLEQVKPGNKILMLSGEGKAFCAGGDVKSLYLNRKSHPEMLDVFFREEFELDYLLSQMKSIQVSVLDGVVMGGGVGVSIHSKVMIVTEKTVFAMPEARIGFITDVGGSYFLSRIKGRVGFLLAITGKRLSGKEMVQLGMNAYYVESQKISQMKQDLVQYVDGDSDLKTILKIINKYTEQIDKKYYREEQINKLFNFKDYKEFDKNLKEQIRNGDELANEILKDIQKQSALSVRVIYEQLVKGESMSLEECMRMDFVLTQKFMKGEEFFEGVRCALVDKQDSPQWKYKDPLEIPDEELSQYFRPMDSLKELLLNRYQIN